MPKRPEVVIRKSAVRAIERGHPWIFKEAIARGAPQETGAVGLRGEDGAALGVGLFDPDSAIAIRMWSRDPHDEISELLRMRLGRCLEIRDQLFDETTTAFRIAHGEGDRMPGIVIDRYGEVYVVKPDGSAAETLVNDHAADIRAALVARDATAIVLRPRDQEACMLHGDLPSAPVTVKEHGVPFLVDVVRGQKTGAFLDQRENRRRVGEIVRDLMRARSGSGARPDAGVRLLNLFSYAGGFSVHAARAGAITTSVDVAAAAHKTAMDTFRVAGVDPKGHSFATADAFVFLDRAAAEKKTWDVVISDPPSFAPSAKSLERALAAYRKLHLACVKVLAPGGVFCAASCSSHVDQTMFVSTLDDHALGRGDLSVTDVYGPPSDHPTLAAWPEGRYLKFVVLR